MKGYTKFIRACETACKFGFNRLWMDTCCIDKSNSSELSEAINSMYVWYKESALCIVYLDDVVKGKRGCELARSKWFKRGWTLQELIAPEDVLFFDKDWTVLGGKKDLALLITDITKVDTYVLQTGNMDGICVAKKMSWAAKRETTRVEDRAYSLMGIFGVNMPTIYGEGEEAFIRLQEEIMKRTDDQSIFAWGNRLSYVVQLCKSSSSS